MIEEETPLLTNACANSLAVNSNSPKNKLSLVTFVAILFFITELVASYFANSLALMSDALTNISSFIITLTAIYFAEKPPTKTHTFGFHRAKVVATLLSVLTIWVSTGFLCVKAVERLTSPQTVNAKLTCITASIGLFVNGVLVGGHHYRVRHCGEELDDLRQKNSKRRSTVLHAIGDLLTSVGVFTSSVILVFKPKYTFIDPICTFVISIIILATTYFLIKNTLAVLMERVPGHIEVETVENSLLQIQGVMTVHDLHVWELSPDKSALVAHVVINSDSANRNKILSKGQQMILDSFGIQYSTLQIEPIHPTFTSHCQPHICHEL